MSNVSQLLNLLHANTYARFLVTISTKLNLLTLSHCLEKTQSILKLFLTFHDKEDHKFISILNFTKGNKNKKLTEFDIYNLMQHVISFFACVFSFIEQIQLKSFSF